MRALLVRSRSPTTSWSFEHAIPFVGKAATYPPLGIATLAALPPPHWELRLRALHVVALSDADLAWADVILVSGMLASSSRCAPRHAAPGGCWRLSPCRSSFAALE